MAQIKPICAKIVSAPNICCVGFPSTWWIKHSISTNLENERVKVQTNKCGIQQTHSKKYLFFWIRIHNACIYYFKMMKCSSHLVFMVALFDESDVDRAYNRLLYSSWGVHIIHAWPQSCVCMCMRPFLSCLTELLYPPCLEATFL